MGHSNQVFNGMKQCFICHLCKYRNIGILLFVYPILLSFETHTEWQCVYHFLFIKLSRTWWDYQDMVVHGWKRETGQKSAQTVEKPCKTFTELKADLQESRVMVLTYSISHTLHQGRLYGRSQGGQHCWKKTLKALILPRQTTILLGTCSMNGSIQSTDFQLLV